MVQEITDQPTQVRAKIIMDMLTPGQQQLDELLGQCFVDASDERTMQQIITMKRHIYNSCYSGITTLQAISEGIAKLTGPKLGQQLLKVFEPIVKPPIESMSKLEASYKQHCDSITILEGIDITIHPIVKTFLLHQMVSKLGEQPKLNSTLGIPLSAIVMQGFKDYGEMVQLIEKAILEYTNDPAQHKPTVAPKVVKVLTDAELKAQVCADFREGPVTGHTCAKTNCKRQHIKGASNCTHPLYLKYGRCPDYYTTCKLLHPFPDSAKAAYGSPGAGWAAFQQDRAKAKKAGRALCPVFGCTEDRSEVGSAINIVAGPRTTRGRNRPQHGFELVAEAIKEADIDFIKASVPSDELQAALVDEDFSEGSDISSYEDPLTLAQEELEQMDFGDQDTALQLQAAMGLLDIDDNSEDYEPSPLWMRPAISRTTDMGSC